MNSLLMEAGGMNAILQNTTLEYKTIWCRLENGGYWCYRSRPADTAEQLIRDYNKVVQPGRRYYAFPQGFDANILGPNPFAPTLLQAIEDHLRHPNDVKYRRIKDQVVKLAIHDYGMTQEAVGSIEMGITVLHQQAEERDCYGTRD
ncbi:hypothetical protein L1N85_24645 [Paenibacillus alkaliterrae]|uniref:hypothetical protein n=1 Tax=Paenibacillus alkaliterrae TaxID=320909 RepID=UPI001F293EF7|nr:hypothetical protein [Paenibacillus alkaliterrae]MCF2941531.1 hypothetical protein [Paenibacillus alkaliterrae]